MFHPNAHQSQLGRAADSLDTDAVLVLRRSRGVSSLLQVALLAPASHT